MNDKVIEKVIENYTRESGVRELDRQLASIMRYQAKELAIKNKIKTTLTAVDIEKFSVRQGTAMKSIKRPICPVWL